MNKIYCPRCGFANDPQNRFCKKCGFNLTQYRQRMKGSQFTNSPRRTIKRPYRQPQRPPMNYGYQRRSMPPQKHHHGLLVTILVIIVVGVLIFAGIGAYSNNSWPFGNGPVGRLMGQETSTMTSSNSNYVPIKTFWNHINNKLDSSDGDGGSSSISYLFQNGSDNYTLNGMEDWVNLIKKSDIDNDITVTSIKPYDFSSDGHKIHYKVRYDFDNHNKGYDRIQVFNWHARVSNGKIVSMASPKTPAEDYNE